MTTDDNAAFARLNSALRAVGDALGRADLEQLLATEPELGAALKGMARVRPNRAQPDMTTAIDQVRAVLLRCRRLGAAMVEFTRTSLDPAGEAVYSRGGGQPPADRGNPPNALALGPSLEARG